MATRASSGTTPGAERIISGAGSRPRGRVAVVAGKGAHAAAQPISEQLDGGHAVGRIEGGRAAASQGGYLAVGVGKTQLIESGGRAASTAAAAAGHLLPFEGGVRTAV